MPSVTEVDPAQLQDAVRILVEARKPAYQIPLGSSLTFEVTELLVSSGLYSSELLKMFATTGDGKPVKFAYQVFCCECWWPCWASWSRTKIVDNIMAQRQKVEENDSRLFTCDKCALRIRLRASARLHQSRCEDATRTTKAIRTLLDTDAAWEVPRNAWFRSLLQCVQGIDIAEFSKAARALPYANFLATPYWKAVAQQVKYAAGFKCQICSGVDRLHAHHRTYEHHGEEHLHLKDLTCLCAPCHTRHHIEPKL